MRAGFGWKGATEADINWRSPRRIVALRQLQSIEQTVADAVVRLGTLQGWEFGAFLESPSGPCIEIRTTLNPRGADPSLDVRQGKGSGQLVCHHNHLSHESLSSADWRGLAQIFNETWAHCADETRYYGRVLDAEKVERVLNEKYEAIEIRAENDLVQILATQRQSEALSIAAHFRKEVINRALHIRGMVEYSFEWGTANILPPAPNGLPALTLNVGHYGRLFAATFDQVALALAPAL
jgi:hypothetical protein